MSAATQPDGQRAAARPRVLLVHANPFQAVLPVPAYGLERLRSAVTDLVDVTIVDPFLHEHPYQRLEAILAATQPDLIGFGIRVIEDCIVIDSLDGDERRGDVHSLLPEIRALRDALGRLAPDVPLLAGGATFSYFPDELLEHLEIDWGVVGAGERVFRDLTLRLAQGRDWRQAPGLKRRGDKQPRPVALAYLDRPTIREPVYGPIGAFPVRTRIGCAMQCSYCLTASIGRAHGRNEIDVVLDEIESLVRTADERGTPLEIFFADDEFNLPDAEHALAVLRGVKRRGLAGRFQWRAYFNPTPFPAELAQLIKETRGHVSLTVDTAADRVAARNGKPFRRRHLDEALATITDYRLEADLGLIFGLPGEDEETLAETIDFVHRLPPEIEVCYSSGARVYPHTPLAALAADDPAHLAGTISITTPAVYSSPWPARRLARHLDRAFAGCANVAPVGVGFDRAPRLQGMAYQALHASELAHSRRLWHSAVDEAGRGAYNRGPGRVLDLLADLAIWHGRSDLALIAVRAQRRLPSGQRTLSNSRLWSSIGVLWLSSRRRPRLPQPLLQQA